MEMNPDTARLARQSTDSPQDAHIRAELRSLLTTEWSRTVMESTREKLAEFFTSSFENIADQDPIKKGYSTLLQELTSDFKSSVVSGTENLDQVKDQKGVIIITNHFGIGVLTIIDNKDGKFPIPLKEFAGFPVRLAALNYISEITKKPIYETAIELPEPLLSIQKATETVLVPIDGSGRTTKLIEDVSTKASENSGSFFVMYPEGGTSGKRNMGSPYDLDTFHSGAFVVSAETGFPILPVCQYLNPETGMELHILKPISVAKEDLPEVHTIMEKAKIEMQEKLNEVQSK